VDLTSADYCRQVEDYLCRKNDGHLIRIVGPAFEQVCGWASLGVPLKVTQRGIDRYFERYYAKGARRRPVRIEFCEADVLDAFDEWRRAVGVPAAAAESQRESLRAHVDRAIARLQALSAHDSPLKSVADAVAHELDAAYGDSKGLRGDVRRAFLERLHALDRALVDAAREACDASTRQELTAEAEADLAPFRDRMPREAYEQSRQAAVDRLVRDRWHLPVLAYD
jgi:hypothetical protein